MISSAFGAALNRNAPLQEHPNPQFQREGFFSLNGIWGFEKNESPDRPKDFTREIVVPFAVETALSGIQERVFAKDYLHYRRSFSLMKGSEGKRIILHFEAVDQIADVFLNGQKVAHHEGGYLPFEADVTDLIQDTNDLYVRVQDDVSSPIFARGKQAAKPGGIWYTPTSGIYQSVWLEILPESHAESIAFKPSISKGSVHVKVATNGQEQKGTIRVLFKGKEMGIVEFSKDFDGDIQLKETHLWSSENPALYDVEIRFGIDYVKSYFAMREVGKIAYQGHYVFALNGKPLFLSGLLDQGYWPESGLTPPSEEAMIADIKNAKELGFNMLRKHIKIEPLRWYYLCDRLGMIVIQDIVSGGSSYNPLVIAAGPFLHPKWNDTSERTQKLLGRGSKASRQQFASDLLPTIRRLKAFPCIVAWTLFNEGWGQFDSVSFTEMIREEDDTRLIDSASGWCDQGAGDFSSRHVYFVKIKMKSDPKRILFLSEFGGYSLHDSEHSWNKKVFGYRLFRNAEKLNKAYGDLYEKQVILMKENGLSACVLTQLSDVEDETNGLYTYDRKVCKADKKLFQKLNKELMFHD